MAIIRRSASLLRHPIVSSSLRLFWLGGIITALALTIIGRLFYLQVLSHDKYAALSDSQRLTNQGLTPIRGDIYVREGRQDKLYPVATNLKLYNIYADPLLVTNAPATAKALAPLLGLSEEELISRFGKTNTRYEILAKQVSEDLAKAVLGLKLNGLGAAPEFSRLYPEKWFGGQLLGFLGFKGDQRVGQYGLEGAYDKELAGTPGQLVGERTASGNVLAVGELGQPAVDGDDLVLTIDRAVQYQACREVEASIKEYRASNGTILVLDVSSGAIIALCSAPDFDPNNYKTVDYRFFQNPAVTGAYEPGSIFKVITMAAGLDLGKVTPNSTYVDQGQVKVDDYVIRNSDLKAHGLQTMTQVLEFSLNTGVIHVAGLMGRELFQRYVSNFGFGQATGVDLAGEVAGDITSLSQRGLVYLYTASFGQGLTATPIQLAASYGAIANNGLLMKPYLVAERRKPDGTVIKTEPQTVRQVIAPKTAVLLQGMLASVVKKGHSKQADIPGYLIAGKTGTAQVAGKGGYTAGTTIQTFVGFAPADEPRFVALVRYDNPSSKFAEGSAVPSFRRLAEFLLNYWQIPPTNK